MTKPGGTTTSKRRPERRPEFVAAVRYANGKRDLFHVRNAVDIADARQVVLGELLDVRTVVIAHRH